MKRHECSYTRAFVGFGVATLNGEGSGKTKITNANFYAQCWINAIFFRTQKYPTSSTPKRLRELDHGGTFKWEACEVAYWTHFGNKLYATIKVQREGQTLWEREIDMEDFRGYWEGLSPMDDILGGLPGFCEFESILLA